METFTEFLKNISIKELKDKKDKPYWQATGKTSTYCCMALNLEAIMWEVKRAWSSQNIRTYHDDTGKWWVGEKGSRKGFKTEFEARRYQSRMISKYGSK